MSIDAISDFDELNGSCRLSFSPTGELGGREVEVLGQESALSCIQLETRQKEGFSFKGEEIKFLMVKLGVRRKDKEGNETEVDFTVDTRNPPSPPPPSPPQPQKPKNS